MCPARHEAVQHPRERVTMQEAQHASVCLNPCILDDQIPEWIARDLDQLGCQSTRKRDFSEMSLNDFGTKTLPEMAAS